MDRGSQVVIVALPRETDRVRKYSSEKEPHLTLLYLGEPGFDLEQLTHVEDYVEHASSLIHTFGLDVVSRGELGDKKADVLFFNKRWTKEMETFRSHLLQDPLISTAYQSTDQFPDWAPHLTMGYPESPAKKDDSEFGQLDYVSFDRIAVWTEDSAGSVYPLKTYEDYYPEVAMADQTAGILEHYGVKGMKWGVQRSTSTGGGASSPGPASADYRTAATAQKKINSSGTQALSNQELQGLLTRMNLERQYSQITASPGKKDPIAQGQEHVKKALAVAKTYEDVKKFVESPTGQAIKTGVAGAATAAAAYFTGGTTAAVGAGAGFVARRMANNG